MATEGRLWTLCKRLSWWLALAAVLVHLASLSSGGEPDRPLPQSTSTALEIVDLRPGKLGVGAHFVVTVDRRETVGTDEDAPPGASIDGTQAELLHSAGDRHVFRVPPEVPLGPHRVWVEHDGIRSAPHYIEVAEISHRKLIRNVVGGLAILFLGVRFLFRGVRRLAGDELRRILGGKTAGVFRAAIVGMVTGTVGQMAATTGGLVSTMLAHRLLAVSSAVVVWIWAQFGSSLAGAVLPLVPVREALVMVALGVVWQLLANQRRSRAIANVVLGLGLMFHGVHLLRVGLATLVAAPETVVPYAMQLDASTGSGLLVCALIGALACLLLQGPGPVFVLASSVAQTTGALELDAALAIVCGGWLGAGIVGLAVSWTSGPAARHASGMHLGIAAAASLVMVLGVDLWLQWAETLLGTDPARVSFGKKVLLPNVVSHLSVGLVIAQLGVSILATLIWHRVGGGLVDRFRESGDVARGRTDATRGVDGVATLRGIQDTLVAQRDAVRGCRVLVGSQRRAHASTIERSLEASRAVLDELMRSGRRKGSGSTGGGDDTSSVGDSAALSPGAPRSGMDDQLQVAAIMSLVQLHHALESVFHFSDRLVERAPELGEADEQRLVAMSELLVAGFDDLAAVIDSGDAIDFEAVQGREIAMNGMEANHRSQEFRGLEANTDDIEARVGLAQLVTAYESAGNQLFRCFQTLDRIGIDTLV